MIEEIVAGALFDFLGFLTTREQPITLSRRHDAARGVELLSEWAKGRGLSLDQADVEDWQHRLSGTTAPTG